MLRYAADDGRGQVRCLQVALQCPLWVTSGLSSQRHSMSALHLKADIQTTERHVRFVPLADIHLRGWPATLVLAKLRSTTTNLWTWDSGKGPPTVEKPNSEQ